MNALLVALQHSDSAFPSGGFAFSQGLEACADLASFDVSGFLEAQIRFRWAPADRVALIRAHRLGSDLEAVARLDREVEASTVVAGLRLGSQRNGMALLTTHARLGTREAAEYRGMVRSGTAPGHLAVVQGFAWRALGVDEQTAVAISGYASLAALAAAAVRLGAIGALEAQATIARLLPVVAAASTSPVADDEPLASFNPLAEIGVMRHGEGGQHLFSN